MLPNLIVSFLCITIGLAWFVYSLKEKKLGKVRSILIYIVGFILLWPYLTNLVGNNVAVDNLWEVIVTALQKTEAKLVLILLIVLHFIIVFTVLGIFSKMRLLFLGKNKSFINAVIENNLRKISNFIKRGINVNVTNEDGKTPLILAVEHNHDQAFKQLINAGADVNLKDNYGKTALMYAIKENLNNLIKILIDKGALLDIQDNEGRTALMLLGRKKNASIDIAELFINNGADLNLVDEDGYDALLYAAGGDNIDLVQYFLNIGADFDASKNDCYSLLRLAVDHNLFEIAKKLLEQGQSPNSPPESETLLMQAASEGQFDMVKILIDYGADVNAKTRELFGTIGDREVGRWGGETALMFAEKNGHTEIVKLLKKAGAKA